MARIIITALSVIGSAFLIGRFFPSSYNAAFAVAGVGITYLMLACMGVMIFTFRATK